MNNNQVQPWYYSWVTIIIALLFFWPIGIALIIMRSTSSKSSVFMGSTNKTKYYIGGGILILLGMSLFSSSKFMGFFMIVGGIALIYYAGKLTKRAERNRKYIEYIVNQDETSLDKIANMCNIQYDTVVKEISQLIKLGVLKNATIDESYRTISIVKAAAPTASRALESFAEAFAEPASSEVVVVKCPGCGAKLTLQRGTTVNCDYCDCPVSAN